MVNKFSNIKERVIYIAKNKGISMELFCDSIGMTYGSFKGSAKERPLNSDAINNILTIYSDINAEWLLLGQGNMFKNSEGDNDNRYKNKPEFFINDEAKFFQRLDAFVKFKNLNYDKITIEDNISQSIVVKINKTEGLNFNEISKILFKYPELDANWLLTGEGDMIKEINTNKDYIIELQKEKIDLLQKDLLKLKK